MRKYSQEPQAQLLNSTREVHSATLGDSNSVEAPDGLLNDGVRSVDTNITSQTHSTNSPNIGNDVYCLSGSVRKGKTENSIHTGL